MPRHRPRTSPAGRSGSWQRAAYRFAWGPSARPLVQGVFAAACELTAGKPNPDALRELGILAGAGDTEATHAPVAELERLLDRAHALGIAGLRRSFRPLARAADGSLRYQDLSTVRVYGRQSVAFAAARDLDRREFNRQFGASLLTEAGARRLLEELRARVPHAFSPGSGLELRFNPTTGPGTPPPPSSSAWARLERPVIAPLVANRRVLDLGSTGLAFPLMLLDAGAHEVVAIAPSREAADVLRTGCQLLSWRDIRPCPLQIITGGLRTLLTGELGAFEVVTACGSLTHLPEEEAARILHTAARLAPVLIVQGSEEPEVDAPDPATLYRLLRESGCADITVHAPDGLSRPLLVGYPYGAAGARYRQAPAQRPA
ncbi:hypothetical protein BH24ACI4_BH24ACI4_22690 [soil metagenome]